MTVKMLYLLFLICSAGVDLGLQQQWPYRTRTHTHTHQISCVRSRAPRCQWWTGLTVRFSGDSEWCLLLGVLIRAGHMSSASVLPLSVLIQRVQLHAPPGVTHLNYTNPNLTRLNNTSSPDAYSPQVYHRELVLSALASTQPGTSHPTSLNLLVYLTNPREPLEITRRLYRSLTKRILSRFIYVEPLGLISPIVHLKLGNQFTCRMSQTSDFQPHDPQTLAWTVYCLVYLCWVSVITRNKH